MDRIAIDSAQAALPSHPQEELAELGFTPMAACWDDARGPVLRYTDGDCISAALYDNGRGTVDFESLLTDGTLLTTAPPGGRRLTPEANGQDREETPGIHRVRLARHKERMASDEAQTLDADLFASLPLYEDRLAKAAKSYMLGPAVAMAIWGPLLALAIFFSNSVLLLVAIAMSVIVVATFAIDVFTERPPGSLIWSWVGPSRVLNADALRATGRDFLGQSPRRRIQPTRLRQLENLGFRPLSESEVRRHKKPKSLVYRASSHLGDDGRTVVHLLERDGTGGWVQVIQSLHADVVVETVVDGELPDSVLPAYRSDHGPEELAEALKFHAERVGGRHTVPLAKRESLVRGMAQFVEEARGERGIARATTALSMALSGVFVPFILVTGLPEEISLGAIAFSVWAARQLANELLASLGESLGVRLPEVVPASIEQYGKELPDEPDKHRFFG